MQDPDRSSAAPADGPPLPRRGFRLLPASVRWITLLAVLLGLAAAAAVATTIERMSSEERAYRLLESDLSRTTRVLALAMQGQLWDYARDTADATVRAMVADDPRVLSVTVFDSAAGHPFVEYRAAGGDEAGARQLRMSLDANGETIGWVEVRMGAGPYLADAQAALRHSLLLTLAMLLLGGGIIMALLQRRLLRPMAALTAATQALSRGDLSREIRPQRRDEVGEVAQALENLRVALLGAFEELRGKNAELVSHAALLEERVEDRTRALSTTNETLQRTLASLHETQEGLIEAEKLASLGRLVAGVAHELNTPLGNALTVLTTLDAQLRETSHRMEHNELRRSDLVAYFGSAREGMDILLRNVSRAAELVRSFKRLAIDQTTDMRRQFDLAEVIDEVILSVQPSFRHTAFRIETDLPAASMDSYPGPLGQVVTNLVLNALRHGFAGRGEGVVRLTAAAPADGSVTLVCSDDGAGMAPEVLRRIFEPFFTTRLGQEGSGLGLHISRNIVMGLLGGRIEASSVAGQGSEFRVTIPLVAPPQGT